MTQALLIKLYATALQATQTMPYALLLLGLFCAAVLQIILPPVPGDALLPTMGALSLALNRPLWGIDYFLGYWIGTLLACWAVMELARRKGDRLLKSRAVRKIVSPQTLDTTRGFLTRHGSGVLLLSKFLPGANTPALMVAGAMDVPRKGSYAAVTLATLGHNGLLFLLGRLTGARLWAIVTALRGLSTAGLVVLALGGVLVLYAYNRLLRRLRHQPGEDKR